MKLSNNYAKKGARWGAAVGLAMGILYSFGGLIIDLMTIGLNTGTALAFMALIGMPVIFGAIGWCIGLLFAVLRQK